MCSEQLASIGKGILYMEDWLLAADSRSTLTLPSKSSPTLQAHSCGTFSATSTKLGSYVWSLEPQIAVGVAFFGVALCKCENFRASSLHAACTAGHSQGMVPL